MARKARRYDLYLPLTFNDGRAVPDQHFDEVERCLLPRFKGLTTQERRFPLRGIWQGDRQIYFDQVIVMTVLDFRLKGSGPYFEKLKRELLHAFDQLEILITESPLRVF